MGHYFLDKVQWLHGKQQQQHYYAGLVSLLIAYESVKFQGKSDQCAVLLCVCLIDLEL